MPEWKPNSKPQTEFLSSLADECLYGGAAGGGKTQALLAEAIRDIDKPDFRALLLRRKFPELQRTLIDLSHKWLSGRAAWSGQTKTWTFKSGAKIEFGHCQNEEDVYQYDSAQYDYIGFDELTTFTEFQYKYLKSRLRGQSDKIFKRIRAASNPGRVGHAWVKRYFPINNPYVIANTYEGKSFIRKQFIPALATDNIDLIKNNPNYINQLESLPEPYRSMLLMGDWNVAIDTFFSEFDEAKHIWHSAVDTANATVVQSMDWGYDAPCALYWHGVFDMGDFTRIITFREIYGNKLIATERARQILEVETEKVVNRIADPASWNKQAGNPSVIEQMYAAGVGGWQKGNNDRVNGWMIMREWLSLAPDGIPFWVITPNCKNLIRTMSEQIADENNPEDMDTDGEDHAEDSCRYMLMSRPRPRKPIEEKPEIRELSLEWIKDKHDWHKTLKRKDKEYAVIGRN